MLAEVLGVAALSTGGVGVMLAGASVVETDADGSAGNNPPSTGMGSSCCSAENSPAWDIARSAEIAPVGAEDGCKKFCKGFPPPTPGAKF